MDGIPAPALNTFAGLGRLLDRSAERRDQSDWLARQQVSPAARFLLLDEDGQAFVQPEHDALRWLDPVERARVAEDLPASLLGLQDGIPLFAISMDDPVRARALEQALPARRASLRQMALELALDQAALFAYAKALLYWQHDTRFCCRCSAPLLLQSAGHRAKCSNPTCSRLHFPRVDPAVIMLVEHDGACLLGRQAGWPVGRYSTLAGFVEVGETLEDAVRREVAEEAGVRVDQVHYHSSQPWPMPASLMLAFTATAHSRDIELRDHELEEARWFTPQDIARGIADGSFLPSPPLSVSHRLLADWLQQRAGISLAELTAASTA